MPATPPDADLELEEPTEPDEELDPDEAEQAEQADGDDAESTVPDGLTADAVEQVERALAVYVKKLAPLVAHVPGFTPCATCDGYGFTIGDAAPPRVAPERFVRCGACNGYGELDTPSLNPNSARILCTSCAGRGYNERELELAAATPAAASLPTPAAAQMGTLLADGRFLPFGATEPLDPAAMRAAS